MTVKERGRQRHLPINLRYRAAKVNRPAVRRLVAHCLDTEGADPRRGLGVVLVGDRVMRRLNRDFRGKDVSTDVLSFGCDLDVMTDADGMGAIADSRASRLDDPDAWSLGEVVVSVPQCCRQAEEQGIGEGTELIRLLVHGVLHVLGYDHEAAVDAAVMRPAERRYRSWASRRDLARGLLEVRSGQARSHP